MSLKNLADEVLISKTEILVREERELLLQILHHLKEIERRRLYSSLGYKSLFDFAVRKLGFSEDQAYRRISAMRLLKEIPEIEDKISEGEISLSHIGLAQSFFKQESKSREVSKSEKLEVFERIAAKSIRDAEKITACLSTAEVSAKPDQIKCISENKIEMKFQASSELQEKIEKLKGLLAHKHPEISLGELFEKLCDLGLEQWSSPATSRKRSVKIGRAISKAQVRRNVFVKAKNQCENCGSNYALEIDHIKPRALGGSDEPKNLRLLCRSCNQRAAIQKLGINKMQNFLS